MRAAVLALLVAAATAGTVVACGESPLDPPDRPEPLEPISEVTIVRSDGFEIFAKASPARVPRGGEVVITSRVVRVGPRGKSALIRICGLDFETEHEFPDPSGQCFGHSAQFSMMPGDTITQVDIGVVDWPRGEHRIRVRHLLQPEQWVLLTVVVE